MKRIGMLLPLLLLSGMGVNAAPKEESMYVQLRADESVPHCTFDKTKSIAYRESSRALVGEFSVHCPLESDYRLTTTLSPFANITVKGTKYDVKWYVNKDDIACEGDFVSPDVSSLHSGNRSVSLTGKGNERWFYCVKLEPTGKNTVKGSSPWPLHGELSLTLTSKDQDFKLPENASRIYVRFENNSSHMSAEMASFIDTLLMNIGDPSQYYVQLHAHTSRVGTTQYNQDLSMMRLKRVREYLIQQHGVNERDTWGQAWGETRPQALNTIDDEASQNRRVDIILIPKEIPKLK